MDLINLILEATGAASITDSKSVQTLWSGYGEIKRYFLEGGEHRSVIVKHIQLPDKNNHPRGWDTETSHRRKLASYQVEKNWYKHFSNHTDLSCKTPFSYHSIETETELLLIIEDLNASGYSIRIDPDNVSLRQAKNCLAWLANFHARFMGTPPDGLWSIGTYWHLDTRPEELAEMSNRRLKRAAKSIDFKLNNANYQTFVHGDAKLANFCFGKAGEVAAVDFQYVGRGPGIKDVAYFISSCFEEEDCEQYEEELLGYYFKHLEIAMNNPPEYFLVKKEWTELYKYAWADFYRFLDGWSPGHWKMHGYSERITEEVLADVDLD